MSFDASVYLRKATSRAKSDVANKLISMFLHGISRKAADEIGMSVTDPVYVQAVIQTFGQNCAYCGRLLETDRAAVEHLQGMNRFRMGLHIPGNVIIACKHCNREKRRDDSLLQLKLAKTGWESFLAHDSAGCPDGCRTCLYWRSIWPDQTTRVEGMKLASSKIAAFRSNYPEALKWSERADFILHTMLEAIYREGQEFATVRINLAIEKALSELGKI